MPIHDLGYKPYVGARRPPSANLWTLARQGLRRALAPAMVKISLVLACLAVVVYPLVYLAIHFATLTTSQGQRNLGDSVSAESFVLEVFDWQLWLFVFVIATAAGAGAVADDVRNRAFQYYFAKPVSPEQYMFGRIYPVALLSFLLTFGPSLVLVGLSAAVAPDRGEALTRVGLLFPALLYSLIIGGVVAVLSVSVSSLSRSKGLTMSLWAAIFFLPEMVAIVVELVTESDWLYLLSIPGALDIVGHVIFKRSLEGQVAAWQAALALGLMTGGALWVLRRKLGTVEIIG